MINDAKFTFQLINQKKNLIFKSNQINKSITCFNTVNDFLVVHCNYNTATSNFYLYQYNKNV